MIRIKSPILVIVLSTLTIACSEDPPPLTGDYSVRFYYTGHSPLVFDVATLTILAANGNEVSGTLRYTPPYVPDPCFIPTTFQGEVTGSGYGTNDPGNSISLSFAQTNYEGSHCTMQFQNASLVDGHMEGDWVRTGNFLTTTGTFTADHR